MPNKARVRALTRLAAALCLLVLCMGFEWPGRLARLTHELKQGSVAERVAAAQRLAAYPAADVREALFSALDDDELAVRIAAARSAAEVGVEEVAKVLVAWLAAPDAEVRAEAAVGLAKLSHTEAKPALAARLGDESPKVRIAAARALAALDAAEASAAIAPLLADVEPNVRAALIEPLAHAEDPAALAMLRQLAQDPHARVRGAAIATLGQRGDRESLALLTRGLEDQDIEVRLRAAAALGDLGDARALPSLQGAFAHADSRLANTAVAALARIDDPSARELLAALVQDPRHKELAQAALLEHTNRSEAAPKAPTADSLVPRDDTMGAAANSAGNARHAKPASLLQLTEACPLVLAPNAEHASLAFDALREIGGDQAAHCVAQGLRHPDAERRARTLHALSSFGGEDTRALLRYTLQRAVPDVSTQTVTSLGEVGDQRDVPALLRIRERLHWPVPAAVSFAIARMAERDVLKKLSATRALCELARSQDAYVRANAAAALAHLSAAPCDDEVHPLRWLSPEHAPAVRAAAARWARAAARADLLPSLEVARALARCASAVDASVRAACMTPELPEDATRLSLRVYDREGQSLPSRAVAVRLADGSVFIGKTDERGQVLLEHAPTGAVFVEDPLAASPEP